MTVEPGNVPDALLPVAYSVVYSFLNERSHTKAAEALRIAAKNVIVLKRGSKPHEPSLCKLLAIWQVLSGDAESESSSSSNEDSSNDDDSDSSDDDNDSSSSSDDNDAAPDSSSDDSDSGSSTAKPLVKMATIDKTKGSKTSSISSKGKIGKSRVEEIKPTIKTKTTAKDTSIPSSSDSDTSSNDDSSSDSDSSSDEEEEQETKETTNRSADQPTADIAVPPSGSSQVLSSVNRESDEVSDPISDDSSSDSHSSSDEEEEQGTKETINRSADQPTADIAVPPSGSSQTLSSVSRESDEVSDPISSSSDSDLSDNARDKSLTSKSAQNDARVVKKRKTSESGASVPTIVASTNSSGEEKNKKPKEKKPPRNTNTPFSRIQLDKINFADERLKDNTFHSRGAVGTDYGARAHQDLIVTRGAGFRKEKNKKKKGNYRGGDITMASHSIKFTD